MAVSKDHGVFRFVALKRVDLPSSLTMSWAMLAPVDGLRGQSGVMLGVEFAENKDCCGRRLEKISQADQLAVMLVVATSR